MECIVTTMYKNVTRIKLDENVVEPGMKKKKKRGRKPTMYIKIDCSVRDLNRIWLP